MEVGSYFAEEHDQLYVVASSLAERIVTGAVRLVLAKVVGEIQISQERSHRQNLGNNTVCDEGLAIGGSFVGHG